MVTTDVEEWIEKMDEVSDGEKLNDCDIQNIYIWWRFKETV